jgi:RES domain-containing protein
MARRRDAQVLDRVLTCYRIGDPAGRYPIFDATGSKLFPGRWNVSTTPIIYSSQHFSTALLEKLVYGNGMLPPNQHYVDITIPPGVSYEVFEPAALPGWDRFPAKASRAHGGAWQRSRRSLLLLVPSIVARLDLNILINPEHPDFHRIAIGLHKPVFWDRRLFGKTANP